MADERAEILREMAQHRGFRLIRSRRRKPGSGDFGKYGLSDENGAPLLGIGQDGLTASADDIENFLRSGAANAWQRSAKIAPKERVKKIDRLLGEDRAAAAEHPAAKRTSRGRIARKTSNAPPMTPRVQGPLPRRGIRRSRSSPPTPSRPWCFAPRKPATRKRWQSSLSNLTMSP